MENRKRIYENIDKDNMILRDYLATERNILANERTYLAYIRTSISLLAAGIGLIKYFNVNLLIYLIGLFFIIAAVIIFGISTTNFFKIDMPLKSLFN